LCENPYLGSRRLQPALTQPEGCGYHCKTQFSRILVSDESKRQEFAAPAFVFLLDLLSVSTVIFQARLRGIDIYTFYKILRGFF
jgi:hypothetical protein